jgi:hypothetical protein
MFSIRSIAISKEVCLSVYLNLSAALLNCNEARKIMASLNIRIKDFQLLHKTVFLKQGVATTTYVSRNTFGDLF